MAKAAAIFLLVALVVSAAGGASAAQCNPGNLVVCAPVLNGSPPSGACCSNLRGQRGCFCQYARNPAYSRYINSANARKALASCKITLPRC